MKMQWTSSGSEPNPGRPSGAPPPAFRKFRHARGFLEVDLVVAVSILTLAVLPLGYGFVQQRQALKTYYCRGVTDEIVDGEMEILLAGAGRNLPEGQQDYTVHAKAATQLPAGRFQLTRTGNHLLLEWTPASRHHAMPIIREGTLK